VEAGLLEQSGQTRARVYRLRRTSSLSRDLRVTPVLSPDRVWEDHVAPVLSSDAPGLRDLCRGAFGELVRNAVEHAGASWITFSFVNNARDIEVTVSDDGAGIFSMLQTSLRASSPRETATMIANLANARATDSPAARLVLLARNFGSFVIRSSGSAVRFDRDADAWTVDDDPAARQGTSITFRARRSSAAKAVHRPVRLAR
jgi:hypothetical protein